MQSLLCDDGYAGQPCAQGVKVILSEHVTAQRAKKSELHAFKEKRRTLER